MNKSSAANIASQARRSAATKKRMSKALAAMEACAHDGDTTTWAVPGYTGTDCAKCGTNLVARPTT